MKRRTVILILLAVVVCAAVVWPAAAHYRAKARVAECRAKLAAAGEKMKVAEIVPVPGPDALDPNVFVMQTAGVGYFSPTGYPPAMRLVAPGRALAVSLQEVLATEDVTNLWPYLEAEVKRQQAALAEVRAAVPAGGVHFNLDYSQGFTLLLPHLARLKNISQALSASTIYYLHKGQFDEAWVNLKAATDLVAGYDREPLMISELVRAAIGAIMVNATWEALQSPGWTEERLRYLEAAWQRVDLLGQAESVLAMERAMGAMTFQQCRESPQLLNSIGGGFGTGKTGLAELAELGGKVLDDPTEGLKQLAHRYTGYWSWKNWQSYEDELVNAQAVQAALAAVRTARREGASKPALDALRTRIAEIRKAHPDSGKFIGFSLVEEDDSLGRFLSRVTTVDMQRSLLIAALTLKRYELKMGRYPANADDLARNGYTLPRDPMDGKPLRYRLQPDGTALLYSAGTDGVDQGGDPAPPDAAKTNSALSRQWFSARDAVWPQPATREQVQSYFETRRNSKSR